MIRWCFRTFFKVLFKLTFNRIFFGVIIGIALGGGVFVGADYTSSDNFCEVCHIHPHVTESWKRGKHMDNRTGTKVHCVDCHLPPKGTADHYLVKAETGLRDLYGYLFKDPESFDWDAKSHPEHAKTIVYKEACVDCHWNEFPIGLSEDGDEAHLYYSDHADELRCINCHLHTGHYDRNAKKKGFGPLAAAPDAEVFEQVARVERFEHFTETLPGTTVSFEMVAVPGGEFTMGSPDDEAYRENDEGPTRKVKVSPFWMGKIEVTWNEYEAFYRATATEGRTDTRQEPPEGVDAISGATPPYGNPDQGWGRGMRPAITMTHHGAETYCQWLSQVTGRTYRLPTEAEWEYACRGGKQEPYFFGGDPEDYAGDGFWAGLFGADLSGMEPYVIFEANSGARTQTPDRVEANPFGIKNLCGNVREFCSDWYGADAYAQLPAGRTVVDPGGPETGEERVVRGGSYRSGPADLRSAARDHTRTVDWLMTDPQIPKSKWWYSDCIDVGFRVVCEYHEEDFSSK